MSKRLVLIPGQSNAVGVALTTALADLSYAYAYPAVRLMAKLGDNANPPFVLTYPPQALDDLVNSAQPRFGIELSLGRRLNHALPNDWAISKFAFSGANLAAHFNPHGPFPTGQPNLFTQLCAYGAQAQVDTDSVLADGGALLVHGESDAGDPATAAAYGDNLVNFVTELRKALGYMPFLYGRLNIGANYPYCDVVRAEQARVNGALPGMIMIDQDSVPLGPDNVHYAAAGYIALGHIYAKALLAVHGIAQRPFASFSTVEEGNKVTFTDTSTDDDGTIVSRAWDVGDSETIVHTYPSQGVRHVTLTVTDNQGKMDIVTKAVNVDGKNWTVDPIKNVGRPSSPQEFQALIDAVGETANAVPPGSLYLFQDPAAVPPDLQPPLADALGRLHLPLSGSGATYENELPGWEAKAVKLTDGVTGGFQSLSPLLPDIATDSCTAMLIGRYQSNAPTSTRNLLVMGSSGLASVRINMNTGRLSTLSGAAPVMNGNADPRGQDLIIWLQINRSALMQHLLTNQELLSLVLGPVAGRGFRIGHGVAGGFAFVLGARWDGPAAEMPIFTMKALSTGLGFVMPP